MPTKTREPHTVPWKDLALSMRSGNRDAEQIAVWAEIREQENDQRPAEVRHALRGLQASFKDYRRAANAPTEDAFRYQKCAHILRLVSMPLPTCNVLPIAQMNECAQWCRAEVRRLQAAAEAQPDLESLDTTAPPEWWAGEAA